MTSVSDAAPVSAERIGEQVVAPEPVRRMAQVTDPGSLRVDAGTTETGAYAATGLVEQRAVRLFACDHGRGGGALGQDACRIIATAVWRAVAEGVPVVGIWHSGGARLQDGTSSLHGVGEMFHALIGASGQVPVISVVLGAAAGGAAYGPALTDVVISGPQGRIFVTGPDIVRKVTGEVVDADALGGPDLHARRSGVLHVDERSDGAALGRARQLAMLLGGASGPELPLPDDPGLGRLVPGPARDAYDMRLLVTRLLDPDHQVELRHRWAPNVVTTLGRLSGRTVGVLANNPWHLAGCLDCAGSEKAAAFVTTCDAQGIPLVVLVDVPGYLPGTEQESGGIVMRGASLLRAFSRARVPRATVIVRKAYGGAFIAMNSKALGADAVLAWPGAEVGVMYPETAAEILHRRLIAGIPASRRDQKLAALARTYERTAGGLERALREGHVDAVIDPAATARMLRQALDRPARLDGDALSRPAARRDARRHVAGRSAQPGWEESRQPTP